MGISDRGLIAYDFAINELQINALMQGQGAVAARLSLAELAHSGTAMKHDYLNFDATLGRPLTEYEAARRELERFHE